MWVESSIAVLAAPLHYVSTEHHIPKPCCSNTLHSSCFTPSTRFWNLTAGICSHSAKRTQLLLVYQFIPKVLDGVEIFHIKLRKVFLYGPGFVDGFALKLKQDRVFPKMKLQVKFSEEDLFCLYSCIFAISSQYVRLPTLSKFIFTHK